MLETGTEDLIDTKTLAQILNLSTRRVQQLALDGLPKVGDGQYPFLKSVHWYIEYLRNIAETNTSEGIDQKEKLLRLKTEREELEVKQLRSELLDAEDTRQALMAILNVMKSVFMGLPGRLSQELTHLEPAEIKAKLDTEFRYILDHTAEKLSNVC